VADCGNGQEGQKSGESNQGIKASSEHCYMLRSIADLAAMKNRLEHPVDLRCKNPPDWSRPATVIGRLISRSRNPTFSATDGGASRPQRRFIRLLFSL